MWASLPFIRHTYRAGASNCGSPCGELPILQNQSKNRQADLNPHRPSRSRPRPNPNLPNRSESRLPKSRVLLRHPSHSNSVDKIAKSSFQNVIHIPSLQEILNRRTLASSSLDGPPIRQPGDILWHRDVLCSYCFNAKEEAFAMKNLALGLALSVLVSLPVLAALKVGEKAPDFSARASLAGKEFNFSLQNALKKGPVVVYFYPSAFTKGCDLEAHTF